MNASCCISWNAVRLAAEFIAKSDLGFCAKSFYVKCFNIHHLLQSIDKSYYPL